MFYNLICNTINILTEQQPNPNNQAFDGKMALIICLCCFLIPVVTLALVVFVKMLIKAIKNNHRIKKEEIVDVQTKYLSLFGEDNIISVSKNMTRVSVEVKDLDKVNFDGLKNLNVGILITGNVIKCSSKEFAENI